MRKLTALGMILGLLASQSAGAELLLPEPAEGWSLYTTTRYSGKISEKFTQNSTIAASVKGDPLPNGTAVIGLEYEDLGGKKGRLVRYIQMEKKAAFGASVPEAIRNGDWEYTSYDSTKKLITGDPASRCMTCHKRAASTDFIFGLDKMQDFAGRR